MNASSAWNPASRPRLRRGVLIAPADRGRWQVRWDFDDVSFLSGESCALVLPWLVNCLDGENALGDLELRAEKLGVAAAFREVIDCLKEQGFVEDAAVVRGSAVSSELPDAIRALRADAETVMRDLADVCVVVMGHSPLAIRIVASVRAQGFCNVELRRADDSFADDAFVVAAETDCAQAELERINAWALAGRHPWMLVGAWNRRLLVGPIFVPGETACYECYRKRLASHRAHLEAYQALDAWRLTHARAAAREPLLPALSELAAAHAALELFHFTTGISPARTVGRVLVYHPADADLTIETVLRIPWCGPCASIAQPGSSGETDLPRSSAAQ